MNPLQETLDGIDLGLDPQNLITCCLDQVRAVDICGTLLAHAEVTEAHQKAALKQTAAELDAAIRESPEDYGIQKITEAAVTNAVQGSRLYQAETKILLGIQETIGGLRAKMDTLRARGEAIRNIIDIQQMAAQAVPCVKDKKHGPISG